MRIIGLVNPKGGVGKTTLTANIGVGLALLGMKVLLIDFDPKADLALSFGLNIDETTPTVREVILGGSPIDKSVIRVEGLDLLPASQHFLDLETDYAYLIEKVSSMKKLLEATNYDYILVDTPSGIGLQIALVLLKEFCVPVTMELFALKSVEMLFKRVRHGSNPQPRLGGILVNSFDARKNLHNEYLHKFEKKYGNKVYSSLIRENIALPEATKYGKTIFRYKGNSSGAQDIWSLAKEIVERN